MEAITLAAAVAAAILTFTGPILPKLWRKLKLFYGSVCRSADYLKQIEKQTLTNVIQGMLISDVGLRHAVQEHYGGVGGEDNWAMDALDSGNESEFSDI